MKQMSWTQVWMFLLLAGFDNGRFRFNYTHLRTYKGGGVRRGPRVCHVAKSLKGKVSVSFVFLKLITSAQWLKMTNFGFKSFYSFLEMFSNRFFKVIKFLSSWSSK